MTNNQLKAQAKGSKVMYKKAEYYFRGTESDEQGRLVGKLSVKPSGKVSVKALAAGIKTVSSSIEASGFGVV
jgi:hypothetical protein